MSRSGSACAPVLENIWMLINAPELHPAKIHPQFVKARVISNFRFSICFTANLCEICRDSRV